MATTVNDEVGDELNDQALQQEIDLLGDLMEAVTAAGHPLCQLEIDRVLGVESSRTRPSVAS